MTNPYLQTYQQVQPWQSQLGIGAQPTNGVVKVNGRDSALQYQLPPNSMSPALFDNNGKTFYIVSTDGTGMKTVEAFDYMPHVEEDKNTLESGDFVARKEYEEFVRHVNEALGALNGLYGAVPTATGARAVREDGRATANDAGKPIAAHIQSMPD